jgi:putative phosphonate metabolism protein
MIGFQRYAVYWVPEPGAFAAWAAAWLGWDVLSGSEVAHPAAKGLPRPVTELTQEPRKYGLHATLKPPFGLAEGETTASLHAALEGLSARLAPVEVPTLRLGNLGGFLALVPPEGDTSLRSIADACVTGLERLRAPLTAAQLARRRAAGLTERQESYLNAWGYPYVLDEFRFHVTLTGHLQPGEAVPVASLLAAQVEPLVPRPFRLDQVALCGEDEAGQFHLIRRYALTG